MDTSLEIDLVQTCKILQDELPDVFLKYSQDDAQRILVNILQNGPSSRFPESLDVILRGLSLCIRDGIGSDEGAMFHIVRIFRRVLPELISHLHSLSISSNVSEDAIYRIFLACSDIQLYAPYTTEDIRNLLKAANGKRDIIRNLIYQDSLSDDVFILVLKIISKFLSQDPSFSDVWELTEVIPLLSHRNELVRCYAISVLFHGLWNHNSSLEVRNKLFKVYGVPPEIVSKFRMELKTRETRRSIAKSRLFSENDHGVEKNQTIRYMTSSFVTIGGISLTRVHASSSSAIASNDLVMVETTQNNLQKISAAISRRLPVLLHGSAGAGKSSLIRHLGSILGKSNEVIFVHLDEHIDSKVLIGTDLCTEVPGEFVWQPGAITQAVTSGKWLVLEDIDSASFEILSALMTLFESRKLFISGRGETIKANPGFQLFGTVKQSPGSSLEMSESGRLIENFFVRVDIQEFNSNDLYRIIEFKYRSLSPVAGIIMDVFQSCRNFLTKKWSRQLSCRDLFKLCNRLNDSFSSLYNEHTGLLTESLRKLGFKNCTDVFGEFLASSIDKSSMYEIIAKYWKLDTDFLSYFKNQYFPAIEETNSHFKIGDFSFALPEKEFLQETKFTITRFSSELMERIIRAIATNEPVLLCGETGNGKTAIIQFVARKLGKTLHVVNLNQQSDSSDFLGGYKPVDLTKAARPLMNSFGTIFPRTFKKEANIKFLQSIKQSFDKKDWKKLVALLRKSVEMGQKIKSMYEVNSQTSSKKKSFSYSELDWSEFSASVEKFASQSELIGKSAAFSFHEGVLISALKKGDWILLDEVNLASSEALQRLNEVLESSTGSITLVEKGEISSIKRHENFRLFACMNPSSDHGKKDLPSGIRSRFTEFFIEDVEDPADLGMIIKDFLSNVTSKPPIEHIATFYLKARALAKEKLVDGAGQKPHFSLRSLCRALEFVVQNAHLYGFYKSLYEGFITAFFSSLNEESRLIMQMLLSETIFSENNDLVRSLEKQKIKHPKSSDVNYLFLEGFYLRSGQLPVKSSSDFILTETVRKRLKDLCRVIAGSGHTLPILLQGPTSAGKTSLVKYIAEATGHKFVRINNHEHTDLQEYLGSYTSDFSGKLVFNEGALVHAVRNGHWIVLDELNLAPSDVLEALNRLLDDNRELFIPETQTTIRPHPNFMLFATQNPAGVYGGRKFLSRAFRNRFIELHIDEIPLDELTTILEIRYQIAPSYCRKMVQIMKELQVRRTESQIFAGKSGFLTSRDLFKWASRKPQSWQELAEQGFMLIGERLRSSEEKSLVKDVIERNCKCKLSLEAMYSTPDTTLLESKGFTWTAGMSRLYRLVHEAIMHNEPVLLVGGTGVGKTTVSQFLAKKINRKLRIINCHQHTETSDFLGSLRPVRGKGQLIGEAKLIIDRLAAENDFQLQADLGTVETGRNLISSNPDACKELSQLISRIDRLFEWYDGPLPLAMKDGDIVLVDEISLAEDAVLERLNSVLESGRTLLLAEKGGDVPENLIAHSDFGIIATMNPGGDFGKKELSPALRSRFTEIWVPSISQHADISMIVGSAFKCEILNPVERIISEFALYFNSSKFQQQLSLRDLLSWVQFVEEVFSFGTITICEAIREGAALIVLEGLGLGSSNVPDSILTFRKELESFLEDLIQKEQPCLEEVERQYRNKYSLNESNADNSKYFGIHPFFISRGPFPASSISYTMQAPSTSKNLLKVLRGMQLGNAILLEGAPGVGKTSLITALASVSGHKVIRINLSEQTDMMDLLGTDLPSPNGKPGQFDWCEGVFLQAMRNGDWVLLDELNLASQSVLEGLNSVLDHRAELFIPELNVTYKCAPGFRIFGCQNPVSQGGGRKNLPASFLNRFSKVYINDLMEEDLLFIVSNLFEEIPEEIAKAMISFNSALDFDVNIDRKYGNDGRPWNFNLRDVFRWCEVIRDCQIRVGIPPSPGQYVDLIYVQKFRSIEDRAEVVKTYNRIFEGIDSARYEIYPTYQFANSKISIGNSTIDSDAGSNLNGNKLLHSRLAPLEHILKATQLNYPLLLIGPSGSGKTTLVRQLATIYGQELLEFSITASTDAIELLGCFEQVDFRRKILHFCQDVENLALEVLRKLLLDYSSDTAHKISQSVSFLRRALSMLGDPAFDEPAIYSELLSKIIELLNSIPDSRTQDLLLRARLLLNSNASAGNFEWVDGLILKALELGKWVLLDNINFCNPAVLDRLNSLLEPNGELLVNECGVYEGKVRVISPHNDFRIFFSMDASLGEVSRAFRNRCIEVALVDDFTHNDLFNCLNAFDIPGTITASNFIETHKAYISLKPNFRNLHSPNRKILMWAAMTAELVDRGLDSNTAIKLSFQENYGISMENFPLLESNVELSEASFSKKLWPYHYLLSPWGWPIKAQELPLDREYAALRLLDVLLRFHIGMRENVKEIIQNDSIESVHMFAGKTLLLASSDAKDEQNYFPILGSLIRYCCLLFGGFSFLKILDTFLLPFSIINKEMSDGFGILLLRLASLTSLKNPEFCLEVSLSEINDKAIQGNPNSIASFVKNREMQSSQPFLSLLRSLLTDLDSFCELLFNVEFDEKEFFYRKMILLDALSYISLNEFQSDDTFLEKILIFLHKLELSLLKLQNESNVSSSSFLLRRLRKVLDTFIAIRKGVNLPEPNAALDYLLWESEERGFTSNNSEIQFLMGSIIQLSKRLVLNFEYDSSIAEDDYEELLRAGVWLDNEIRRSIYEGLATLWYLMDSHSPEGENLLYTLKRTIKLIEEQIEETVNVFGPKIRENLRWSVTIPELHPGDEYEQMHKYYVEGQSESSIIRMKFDPKIEEAAVHLKLRKLINLMSRSLGEYMLFRISTMLDDRTHDLNHCRTLLSDTQSILSWMSQFAAANTHDLAIFETIRWLLSSESESKPQIFRKIYLLLQNSVFGASSSELNGSLISRLWILLINGHDDTIRDATHSNNVLSRCLELLMNTLKLYDEKNLEINSYLIEDGFLLQRRSLKSLLSYFIETFNGDYRSEFVSNCEDIEKAPDLISVIKKLSEICLKSENFRLRNQSKIFCLFSNCMKSDSASLWVLVGLFRFFMTIPVNCVDPVKSVDAEYMFSNRRLEFLERDYAVKGGVEHFYRESFEFPGKGLEESKLNACKDELNKLESSKILRVKLAKKPVVTFVDFYKDVTKFINAFCNPDRIFELIHSRKFEQLHYVQESIVGFINQVESRYSYFSDFADSMVVGLKQVVIGLKELCRSSIRNYSNEEVIIRTLSSVVYKELSANDLEICEKALKSLVQNQMTRDSLILKLRQMALIHLQIQSGYIEDFSQFYPLLQFLIFQFVEGYLSQKAEMQRKIDEQETFDFKFIDPSEDIKKLVSRYFEDNEDESSKSEEKTQSFQLSADDLIFTYRTFEKILDRINVLNQSPDVSLDEHMCLYQKMIHFIASLNKNNIDLDFPIGCNILLPQLTLLVEELKPNKKLLFHLNIEEMCLVEGTIHAIMEKLRTILNQFPEHPILLQLVGISERILRYKKVEASLVKIIGSLQLLLLKLQQWDQYSSREFSFKPEISSLMVIIVKLRKRQLSSWSAILDDRREHHKDKAVPYWIQLVSFVFSGSEFSVESLIEAVESFIRSSSAGQFQTRIKMISDLSVLAFIYNEHHPQRGHSLRNLSLYYEQFIPKVENFLALGTKPIEQKMKERVKLVKWDVTNVHSLELSSQKVQKDIVSMIKSFDEILDSPISMLLSPENPDLEKDLSNLESLVSGCISPTFSVKSENLILQKSVNLIKKACDSPAGSAFFSTHLLISEFSDSIRQRIISVKDMPIMAKKKCVVDVLNEMKDQGFSYLKADRISTSPLTHGRTFDHLFQEYDPILPGFSDCWSPLVSESETLFFNVMTLLDEIRQWDDSAISKDLQRSEIQKSKGILENLFGVLCKNREISIDAMHTLLQLKMVYQRQHLETQDIILKSRFERLKTDILAISSSTKESNSCDFEMRDPNSFGMYSYFARNLLTSFSSSKDLDSLPQSSSESDALLSLQLRVQAFYKALNSNPDSWMSEVLNQRLKISGGLLPMIGFSLVTSKSNIVHDGIGHESYSLLTDLSEYLTKEYVLISKSLCKLSLVLILTLRSLFKFGFCRPEDEDSEIDDNEQGAERPENGTGMGEGTGDKDVSNEIEDAEQLLGLKDEAKNENEDQNEPRNNKDEGFDMDEDFEGDLTDMKLDDDDEDGDDEENENIADEMGKVDPNEEEVLDEKLWNDEEDDNECPENDDLAEEKQDMKMSRELQGKEDDNNEETIARPEGMEEEMDSKPPKKEDENDFPEEPKDDDEANQAEFPDKDVEMDDYHDFKKDGHLNDEEDGQDDNQDSAAQNEEENIPEDLDLDENESVKDDMEDEVKGSKDADLEEDLGEELGSDEDQLPSNPLEDIDTNEFEPQAEEANVKDEDSNDLDHAQSKESTSYEATQQSDDQNNSRMQNDSTASEPQAADLPKADESSTDQNLSSQVEQLDSNENSDLSHRKQNNDQNAEDSQPSQSNSTNPYRSIGDATKKWQKRLEILEKTLQVDNKNTETMEEDTDISLAQHIEDSDNADAQVMAFDENESNREENPPDLREQEDEAETSKKEKDRADQPDEIKNDKNVSDNMHPSKAEMLTNLDHDVSSDEDIESSPEDAVKDSEENPSLHEERENMIMSTLENMRSMDSEDDTNEPVVYCYKELIDKNIEDLNLFAKSKDDQDRFFEEWKQLEYEMHDLALQLTEQLRILLEPLEANKLQGDYRTGKRLNMRKIIPYIASQFRKDKIWMRRTKAAKRNYQVMICIDDSRSMLENEAGRSALKALNLLCSSLTRLEIGDIGLMSFGEEVRLLQKLDSSFSAANGAFALSKFNFSEQRTNWKEMLHCVSSIFDFCRQSHKNTGNSFLQIAFVISDARIQEDQEKLAALVRESMMKRQLVVVLVVDTADERKSIINLKSVNYDANNKLQVHRYLDSFPFPFYVIIKEMESLPMVIADALRQWFELVRQET